MIMPIGSKGMHAIDKVVSTVSTLSEDIIYTGLYFCVQISLYGSTQHSKPTVVRIIVLVHLCGARAKRIFFIVITIHMPHNLCACSKGWCTI